MVLLNTVQQLAVLTQEDVHLQTDSGCFSVA